MAFMKVHVFGLAIFLSLRLRSFHCCRTENTTTCEHYSMISKIDIHAFIPLQMLDTRCRNLQSALRCAYSTGELDKCGPEERYVFDTQRGVVDVVCSQRKDEYVKSARCFLKSGVQSRIIKECMTALVNSGGGSCRTFTFVANCARTKIMMTDGCDTTDGALMKDLVDVYLKPGRKKAGCPVERPKTEAVRFDKVKDEGTEDVINVSVAVTSQAPELERSTGVRNFSNRLSPKLPPPVTEPETRQTLGIDSLSTLTPNEADDTTQGNRITPSSVNDGTQTNNDLSPETEQSKLQPLPSELPTTANSDIIELSESIDSDEAEFEIDTPTLKQLHMQDSTSKSPQTDAAHGMSSASSMATTSATESLGKVNSSEIWNISHGSVKPLSRGDEIIAHASKSTQAASTTAEPYIFIQVSTFLSVMFAMW